MTGSSAEVSAFIRSATAAAGSLCQAMATARGGLMSVEDADALRTAVEDFGRLRVEGERLAASIDFPEFAAWIEGMRDVEIGPREMVASMRPVLPN